MVKKFIFSSFENASIKMINVGHKLNIIFISIDFSEDWAKVIENAKHNSKITKSRLEINKNLLETFLKSGSP